MNGPDHYREAENSVPEPSPARSLAPGHCVMLDLTKLHTALAQVAATALNSDGREWADVAGYRFSRIHLAQLRLDQTASNA